jgi:hypothetical protein
MEMIINGITIDIRSDESLYVTIGDWTIYLDDSTGEKIITAWED